MKTSPKKSGKFLSLLKEFFSWLAYQNVRAQVVVFLTIFSCVVFVRNDNN